jgi:hypothetical protein
MRRSSDSDNGNQMGRSPAGTSATSQERWAKTVGELTEVGFSADESYLLLVSHAGRGIVETMRGSTVARRRASNE